MLHFYERYNLRKRIPHASFTGLFFLAILVSCQVMAQYNVTVTTDGSATNQLRGAIVAADAAGGTSTINVAAGTYNLTLGEITFGRRAQNITITGAGSASTIINMTSTLQDRIFLVNPPGDIANIQTTISGITFTGGRLTSDPFGGGAIICGGPGNSMTLNNCVFNNNTVTSGGNGGALQMNGGGALSLNQCTFTNNICPTGTGGALYYFLPNTINGVNLSGSLSVTNCTFNNNSVTPSGSTGGAIDIGVQGMAAGGGTTSTISILRNNFTNNHANTSGNGGAISITNSFSPTNTALINYNRFVGNTATNGNTSALAMSVTQGSVDASNNWWGCNTGAGSTGCSDRAAVLATPVGGTLTITPYLQLTATASATAICSGASNNTSVITASFLKNSAGTAVLPANLTTVIGLPVSFTAALGNLSGAQTTIQSSGNATVTYTSNGTAGSGSVNAVVDNVPASDATAKAAVTVNASPAVTIGSATVNSCSGNTVSLTVTATGSSLVYQWYKGATMLTNGATGTGSTLSGVTAATLNIVNAGPSDNASNYNVVVSNTCQTTSGNIAVTVAAPALATGTTTGSGSVTGTNTGINDASCQRIVNVLPSGGAPVSGNVTASVTIDGSQQSYKGQPYVIRHYDITPASNPNTATATITLYFLQSEFDTYNTAMAGTVNDLPTGPADATGRANLRITQFHGTGTTPANYTGWGGVGPSAVLINPGLANVIWNATLNWWEVSFSVTGFSGFYATGLISYSLPIQLESFTGSQQGADILLNWLVSEETNLSHYEVETSSDAIHFTAIRNVTATNKRNYSLSYNAPANGLQYYRLKIMDDDGKYVYSNVIAIDVHNLLSSIQVSPNPFRSRLKLEVEVLKRTNTLVTLTDLDGRILLKQQAVLVPGSNTIIFDQLDKIAQGSYILRIVNDQMNKTVKVVKMQ